MSDTPSARANVKSAGASAQAAVDHAKDAAQSTGRQMSDFASSASAQTKDAAAASAAQAKATAASIGDQARDLASNVAGQAKDAASTVAGHASDAASNLGAAAASYGQQAKDTAAAYGQQAKDTATVYGQQARDSVVGMAGDMLSSVKDSVEAHKSAGAEAVAGMARSAQGLADQLEPQSPQVAGLVRNAASSVERVSNDIRDRPVGDLVGSLSDFARRQPVAFFGCGILAGIVLSRLIRGSDNT